jgi:uncharacterized lipoprotein YmbA
MSPLKAPLPCIATVALGLLVLTSCASPPLSLYTLKPDDAPVAATAFRQGTPVIEVKRVIVPDYLDSQDILVRNGNTLQRSSHGRWASRLSTEVTRYVTEILATRHPLALVTDQPPVTAPNARLSITISNMDVTSAGVVTLEANWEIVPKNPAMPVRHDRARFTARGPVKTDQDVVVLTQAVLTRLADVINIARL